MALQTLVHLSFFIYGQGHDLFVSCPLAFKKKNNSIKNTYKQNNIEILFH